MFWKHVKVLPFKAWSLVTRLMLAYSVATLGLLMAIGLFLYPTYIEILQRVDAKQVSAIALMCTYRLFLTIGFSYLASIVLGFFIARQGLSRIAALEKKLEAINANSLCERLSLDEWPKELKKFAQKFNLMLDRLQNSFNQLSQFSSNIAHELRTPLHNLRGMTEVALANPQHSEAYRLMLEKYMEEYLHLSKLVENLLFLARADHGELRLSKKIVDLRQLVLDIFEYYQAMTDENNIRLVCRGEAQMAVDPLLFKRVMVNLISNAVSNTPLDGEIIVDMQADATGVAVLISDNGTGIPPEHLARLFERFYRVSHAGTGGIGLGLAIVKSILQAHGATIDITSQLHVGTQVKITFPLFSAPLSTEPGSLQNR